MNECIICQENKNSKYRYCLKANRLNTEKPLEHISNDVYGPFDAREYSSSKKIKKLILITFKDRHSRYTKIFITNTITTKALIKGLETEWIKENRLLKTIFIDRGRCHTRKSFKITARNTKLKTFIPTHTITP